MANSLNLKLWSIFLDYEKKIDLATRIYDEDNCKIHDDRPSKEQRRVKSEYAYWHLLGEAMGVFKCALEAGTTGDEMNKIVRYCRVISNSQRHFLDWRKAKKYFGFKEIKAKYKPRSASLWEG